MNPPNQIMDPKGILGKICRGEVSPVVLDLGCGWRKFSAQAIGVDASDHEGVDIRGEVLSVLKALPPNSVDKIYSSHLFEHLGDLEALFLEIERVLKNAGLVEVIVPHFSNPYFYSDYTHSKFFGLYSLSYLCDDPILRRKVPCYSRKLNLRITDVRLQFRSPFRISNRIRGLISLLVNSSCFMKEFYEENLVYLLPCYEIRWLLVKQSP